MKDIFLSTIITVISIGCSFAQPPATHVANFRHAAKVAIPGVVAIRSELPGAIDKEARNFLLQLFGEELFKKYFGAQSDSSFEIAGGSGVILSGDGYIVTDFHVVDKARSIEVTLYNQRKFLATVIGLDQPTDLALLKIDATGLPYLHFANSGGIEIGDLVLAIGNPYALPSTVTMGIISAKTRKINLATGGNAVGAFLQTDAVVNPGNSGGALVDLDGRLIGITAVIASSTGSYAGYSFAIPSDIVQKTLRDLIRYGKVLHTDIGAILSNMDQEQAEAAGFSRPTGVCIDSLDTRGPAEKAGLRKGDVITSIDGYAVETVTRLRELVARHTPGETISLSFIREGQIHWSDLTLEAQRSRKITAPSAGSLIGYMP